MNKRPYHACFASLPPQKSSSCMKQLLYWLIVQSLLWLSSSSSTSSLLVENGHHQSCNCISGRVREVRIGPGLERKRIASHTLSCTFLVRFGEVLEILQIIDLAVFTSLRTFALSDRNWRIALPVLISSLVPAGLDLYYYLNQTPIELSSPINCTTIDGVTESIDNTQYLKATPFLVSQPHPI
ncbi:hypothetical protein A0H81_02286 [Grifola frondosa]|uniref:Uncharacterized protein n=1 Tax=Grifola frondosa TaxID=5627 RepID=A0A1C7MMM5_GRIFR|nr:hypothetical protein A0H81_02286 [Grifola frondosa]